MTPTLVLTIRNHAKQGEKILGIRWLPFIESLRDELRRHGAEHKLSTDALLIFTFTGHYSAFSALLSSFEATKQAHHWPAASGPTPIQFIIDLLPEDTPLTAASLPDKKIWDEIQHESIYIGPALVRIWQEFSTQTKFPSHQLLNSSSGYTKITFKDHDLGKQEPLLAYRNLPVAQSGKECFYCGMTTHQPAHCPSKMLGMDSWGLGEVGYLTFEELNTIYKKVFPEKKSVIARLAEGVKTVSLRKDKELLVFVAFFDLSAIFQLRFLWNYAFSSYSKWSTIFKTDKVKIDNRNLHMGLDCLRVGQYEQAEELLQSELKRQDGHRFAANIALALLSLECNRTSDVGLYLETARNLTKTAAEAIYINLLLSRHFELLKDFWNAKESVTNALKEDYDCLDVQYRRIQLSLRESRVNDKEFKQLRSLVLGQKDIFIKSLIDPSFTPIQGILDETLLNQYKTIAQDAEHNLNSAISEVKQLSMWLDKKDKRNIANKKSIAELQKQLEEKSYFHLLDVSEKANGIFFECRRLRKAQADQLELELDRHNRQLETYHTFWKRYPYKRFHQGFPLILIPALNSCRKAIKLLKENSSSTTKEAIELAKIVKTGFKSTEKEYRRLLLIRTVMNGLKVFATKLIICEAIALLLVALTFPAITATLSNTPSLDWLIQLSSDSGVQKRSFLIATLFIAPFIALSWALIELQREE